MGVSLRTPGERGGDQVYQQSRPGRGVWAPLVRLWRRTGVGARLRCAGVALVLVGTGVLAGCASSDADLANALNTTPPGEIYNEADALLSRGKYMDAAAKFEQVDKDHPYSPFARRAIVMAAFAHYKNRDYDEAILAAQRYVTLHPGTKESALAHHIIANSYYDQIKDPKRDQTRTKRALEALKTVVRQFPDTRYAEQARNRINITMDILAASEMNVGRYYLKRNNHLAAINRFRTVVTEYQTTAHVEEALMRLTEAYMAIGVQGEAQTAAAVLGHNFPDSEWYKHSYKLLASGGLEPRENTGSWISRALRNVNPF